MEVRLAASPTIDSIVDGVGLRTVFWFQGCLHHCAGCHNPSTWSLDKGFIADTDELVDFYLRQKLQSGVTISGGDPFYQTNALLDLSMKLKRYGTNIWVYTGFMFEELQLKYKDIIQYIDVLVDGLFILEQRDLSLYFKGSRNQRVIDIQNSLLQNKIILVDDLENE